MLNEWSDREPDPEDRPWVARVMIVFVALATFAMLAQLAMCATAYV